MQPEVFERKTLGGLGGPGLLILLFILGVGEAFLVVHRISKRGGRDARDILNERYARGELGEEDYQRMRQGIES